MQNTWKTWSDKLLKQYVNRIIPIESLLKLLGVSVTSAGFARCPRHADNRPSVRVYGAKSTTHYTWYCFECCKGGGVVEWLAFAKQVPYRTAALSLAKRFNLSPTGFFLDLPLEKTKKEKEEKIRLAKLHGFERCVCSAFLSRIFKIEPEELRVFIYQLWMNFIEDYLDRVRYHGYDSGVVETELKQFIVGGIAAWRRHRSSLGSQSCSGII